jgi:SPX domain protein involved in polyphosphate accumulation
MPTSLPPSVREQFGEAAAEDFVRWLDETLQQQTVLRDEYREVLSRLDVLEERFEHLEQRLDQRFEQQSAQFNERIDGVHDRIDRLHEVMRVQTRWTVGTIALFGTIVTVLPAIAEFGA